MRRNERVADSRTRRLLQVWPDRHAARCGLASVHGWSAPRARAWSGRRHSLHPPRVRRFGREFVDRNGRPRL